MLAAISPEHGRPPLHWRMRAALALDVAVGVATVVMYPLGILALGRLMMGPEPFAWRVIVPLLGPFALSGVLLVMQALLLRGGQSIGLAVCGLRWQSRDSRDASRRVFGEPQVWCAVLPAAYIVLSVPLDCLQILTFVQGHPISPALPVWCLFPPLVGVAIVCTLVCRRSPGRLVHC